VYQLDFPLSATARGDYHLIAIEAASGAEPTRTLVPIRVR